MRASEFLREFDEKKVSQLTNMLSSRARDNSRPQTDSAIKLAQTIEHMGITNGEQIFWLLHRYLKPQGNGYGIRRWEDIATKAISAIKLFDQLKKKRDLTPPLATKDLNQIKTLDDLVSMLDTYKQNSAQTASRKEQDRATERKFYETGQAKLIYNDSNIKIVMPKTEKASCYFGINTKWCTSAETDNAFNDYKKYGSLYIILIKKENARYQFFWSTDTFELPNEFNNEKNEPINPQKLADKYPILWQIFDPISRSYNSVILVKNPPFELQMAAVKDFGLNIQYIKNPPLPVQLVAVKQYGWAISFIEDPSVEVQIAAVQNDGDAIRYIKDPSPEVELAAVKQWRGAIKHIKNPTPEVQEIVRKASNDESK